ncbi:MAG: hypothetical protein ACO1SX_00575 [Actinomycetota bacterium]
MRPWVAALAGTVQVAPPPLAASATKLGDEPPVLEYWGWIPPLTLELVQLMFWEELTL